MTPNQNPERSGQPPVEAGMAVQAGYSGFPPDGETYSTPADAYAAAVAAIALGADPGPPQLFGTGLDISIFSEVQSIFNFETGMPYGSANVYGWKYWLAGYSATGYLKIWVKKVLYSDYFETIASSSESSEELTFGDTAGLTIPGNLNAVVPGLVFGGSPEWSPSRFSPWYYTAGSSELIIGPPPDPYPETATNVAPYNAGIGAIKVYISRFSAVQGYEPPADGSANGFPAA